MAERAIIPDDNKSLASDAADDKAIPAGSYDELWEVLRERKIHAMSTRPQPLTSTSEASRNKRARQFDKLFLKPRMIHRMTESSQNIRFALRDEIHQALQNILPGLSTSPHEYESVEKLIQGSTLPVEEVMSLFERLLKAKDITPSSFQGVRNRFTDNFALNPEDDLVDVFRNAISSFTKWKDNEADWESFWEILPGSHRPYPSVEESDPSIIEKHSEHCFVKRRFKCPVRDKRKGAQINILGPPPLYECVKDFRSSNVGKKRRIKISRFGDVVSKPFNHKLVPMEKADGRCHDWLVDAAFNFFLRAGNHVQQPFLRLSLTAGGCPLILYEFKDDDGDGKAEEGERYLAFTSSIFLWEIIQLTALGKNLEEMSKGGLPQEGIPIYNHSHFHLYSVLICGTHFRFYKTRIAARAKAQEQYSQGRNHNSLPVSFFFESLANINVASLNDLELVFRFLATITVDAYYHMRPVLIKYGILLEGSNSWQEKNGWINDFGAALTYRTTEGDDNTPYTLVPMTNFKVTFVQEDDSDELTENENDEALPTEGEIQGKFNERRIRSRRLTL